MGRHRTVQETINALRSPVIRELPAPPYRPYRNLAWKEDHKRLFLACASMEHHTADAGWQLTLSLQDQGYKLCGRDLTLDSTHVPTILDIESPQVVVLQDKREWEGHTAGQKGSPEKFYSVGVLKERDDIFKMTVLKDAQQRPEYHADSAEEIGCHAWITYYHPDIVKHVAPFVRQEHLVRNYHSIDREVVPRYEPYGRKGCLISGAVSSHYPLRKRLVRERGSLPDTFYRPHPGYGHKECDTPNYLKELAGHMVAVCTSSRYGYTLRKIIEATACGCRVITDLPVDDVLPEIDKNLVRVHPDDDTPMIRNIIRQCIDTYDPHRQEMFSQLTKSYYDWREAGRRLHKNITDMRKLYASQN